MKTFLSAIFLLASFVAFSQRYIDTNDPDKEEIKSLLNKENDLKGFGGTDLKVGDLKGERGLLVGAYGGFMVNKRFMLGVAGYGLVTRVEFDGTVPNQPGTRTLNLHGGYGGILVGAAIAPQKLIHINIPILFGAGAFEVVDKHFFTNTLQTDTEFTIENTVFFIMEPGIELEFNITNYLRIGVGATYRYITGTELINVSDREVSGGTGMISFRFGRF